jgi:hypothetical protein
MVEEDEGANHAPLRIWQHVPDLKPTEVAAALMDHKLDHVRSPRELPPSPFLHAGGEHECASADGHYQNPQRRWQGRKGYWSTAAMSGVITSFPLASLSLRA